MNQHRPRRHRAVARALAAGLVLVAGTACTSDSEGPTSAPTRLPSRSVESGATLDAKPVPMQVSVAKLVGGKLPRPRRLRLEHQVSRVVSRYFDAAFLAGDYPRADFSGALTAFSPGAARRAAPDRDLVTNAGIGTSTEAVAARVKAARLDVLVPHHDVVGLTARVRLVFVQQRTHGADQRVTVKGRLLMNRRKSGAWQIFGYDLSRSAEAAGEGSGR